MLSKKLTAIFKKASLFGVLAATTTVPAWADGHRHAMRFSHVQHCVSCGETTANQIAGAMMPGYSMIGAAMPAMSTNYYSDCACNQGVSVGSTQVNALQGSMVLQQSQAPQLQASSADDKEEEKEERKFEASSEDLLVDGDLEYAGDILIPGGNIGSLQASQGDDLEGSFGGSSGFGSITGHGGSFGGSSGGGFGG